MDSINRKMLYIILAATIALLVVGYFVFHNYFFVAIKSQENAQIQSNIQNVLMYVDGKFKKNEAIALDWGHWDETYEFIAGSNKEYVEANLMHETFNNLNVNMLLFYDNNNNLIYYKNDDLKSNVFKDASPNLINIINKFVLSSKNSSILEYNNTYYFASVIDVTDSLLTKPSNGKVVICTEIGEDVISDLKKVVGGMVNFSSIISNANIERQSFAENAEIIFNKSNLSIYIPISKYNNFRSEIVVEKSRSNYNFEIGKMKLFFSLYSVFIVIVSFALFFLLNFYIFKPFQKREDNYKFLVSQMKQGLASYEIICNDDGQVVNYRFLYVNESFENIMGVKSKDVIGKTILEVFPNTKQYWISKYGDVALGGKPFKYQRFSQRLGKYYEWVVYQYNKNQFATIITDITDIKEIEDKLKYYYYHDELTGLNNRRYINEKLPFIDKGENLPISVIIGDINGLKIINDAFGLEIGDKIIKRISEIIKAKCRPTDIVAKWGGDEFLIILPKTNFEEAESVVSRIKEACSNENVGTALLSISFGWDTKQSKNQNIEDIIISAGNHMCNHKIIESVSMRGQTINTILATLHEKNEREERHSRRVSELCVRIGKAIGLTEIEINKLRAIGLLHDIGKITISESILNKGTELSNQEWIEMRKHTDVGFKILSSTNETAELAPYLLYHHERMDGKGYPHGISGKDIPLITRILSVADSYDAMTSRRTYRDAMSEEYAINQLLGNSGTQFDGDIVKIFIEKVVPDIGKIV